MGIGWRRLRSALLLLVMVGAACEVFRAVDFAQYDTSYFRVLDPNTWLPVLDEIERIGAELMAPGRARSPGASAALGAFFLVLVLARARLLEVDTAGRVPWELGRRRGVAMAVLLASALTAALPGLPTWSVFVLLSVAFAISLHIERGAFLAAVRAGRIPSWVLRPASEGGGDVGLPVVIHGRGKGEVLEHLPLATYRAADRVAMARVIPFPIRKMVYWGVAICALAALAAFAWAHGAASV